MTTALRPAAKNGQQLDQNRPALSPIESFRPLDVYAGGVSEEPPRVDAICSISAGYRAPSQDGKPGLPQRSKNGEIYIHDATGRAPGLAAILKANGGKRLTIAFASDDPHDFIQQRFTNYSASSLLAYGDERSITTIGPNGQTHHAAGTEGYAKALEGCKVSVSVFFALAEWTEEGPAVAFVDGFSYYRLKFTSRHSLRNLIASLADVSRLTGGHIAGLPFEIAIDYREVADPKGAKRTIPVWTFVPKPPNGIKLTSRNFRAFAGASLEQGQALMLPTPSAETWAMAELDGPLPDMDNPTERDVMILSEGGHCDKANWLAQWHATCRGTVFEDADERAEFLRTYTQGGYASLARFLDDATENEASGLIAALKADLATSGPDMVDGVAVADGTAVDVIDLEDGTGIDLDEPLMGPTPEPTAEPTPERRMPDKADWAAWTELADKAEALGVPIPALPDPTTRGYLLKTYDQLRAACIEVKARNTTAVLPSAPPPDAEQRRKGLMNEYGLLSSRAKDLNVLAAMLPAAIDDLDLFTAVADLRERVEMAATEAERLAHASKGRGAVSVV